MQSSVSRQSFGAPPTHVPALQVSSKVQALPSLHAVPSGAFGFEQMPVDVSHTPATWHESDALQTTGLPLMQLPDWQVSLTVQPFPSVQVVPLGAAGFEQTPVEGLHAPATWH